MRIENHPVLEFDRSKALSFIFEETQLKGFEGETIASALHANGVKVLRHDHRPRGFYCAIGNCSSCLMEVNGEPNVRVCTEPLVNGMVVKRQIGKGAFIGGEK